MARVIPTKTNRYAVPRRIVASNKKGRASSSVGLENKPGSLCLLRDFFDGAIALGFGAEQVDTLQGDADGEGASLALDAFYPGVAAMLLGDAFHDEQAQAIALDSLMLTAAHAPESLKEVLLVFLGDAQPGITHG